MNADTPIDSTHLHAERLKSYIAALDRMSADTQKMLTDLEANAPIAREHPRSQHANIMQMYLSRLSQSIETRCRNLRVTLDAIERERLRAQAELGAEVPVDKT